MADFSGSGTAAVGDSVSFADHSTAPDGTIAHALWDFGDGAPATSSDGIHAYTRAGTYRVALVVWDDTGRGALHEGAIVVGPATKGR